MPSSGSAKSHLGRLFVPHRRGYIPRRPLPARPGFSGKIAWTWAGSASHRVSSGKVDFFHRPKLRYFPILHVLIPFGLSRPPRVHSERAWRLRGSTRSRRSPKRSPRGRPTGRRRLHRLAGFRRASAAIRCRGLLRPRVGPLAADLPRIGRVRGRPLVRGLHRFGLS